MKKILITFILVSSCQIFAQDTNIIKYLPLKVGNVWVYHFSGSYQTIGTTEGYDRYTINGTIQVNNHIYYTLQRATIFIHGNITCGTRLYNISEGIRIDSASGNIYRSTNCGISNNGTIDSLKTRIHDTSNVCNSAWGNRAVCMDTSIYTNFGNSYPSKTLRVGFFEGWDLERYAKSKGVVYSEDHYAFGGCSSTLTGCIIDGILYGDTSTIVGLNQLSSEVPNSFTLYQNYPNPFNPTTSIKFSVLQKAFVTITIYNVIGEEISKLVSTEFSPGTYETEWDASNYPSGVYYYKLAAKPSDRLERSDGYTETKKMVFLK